VGKNGPSREKLGAALVPFHCGYVSIGGVAGPVIGEIGRKMQLMVCFTLIMVAREKYGI
jgi:fucose permease